jgi:hypothetical protein
MFGFQGIVMAGLDPAIPLKTAQPCHIIGIAGSSPAMTAGVVRCTTRELGDDMDEFGRGALIAR